MSRQEGRQYGKKTPENKDTEQMLDRVDIISDITGEALK